MIKISASLMCADYSNLAEQVKLLEKAGVDMLHFDIMDGDFVPNFAMSQLEMKALRSLTSLTFDVHLMIKEPIRYIKQFADAGADILTVHAEACEHLGETIQEIKEHGKKAAVALNPSTPLFAIQHMFGELWYC
jgi:ribulose-phosphate 3-epimerase|tara:strand:- start:1211 stop:1612 length:402 start_codon:yes stop_codon:yes gene_type:complete